MDKLEHQELEDSTKDLNQLRVAQGFFGKRRINFVDPLDHVLKKKTLNQALLDLVFLFTTTLGK